MYIFELWSTKVGSNYKKIQQVLDSINTFLFNIQDLKLDALHGRVNYICTRLSVYWQKSNRTKGNCISKYYKWLNEVEQVEISVLNDGKNNIPRTVHSRGRPRKEFDKCSSRSKRRRTFEMSKLDSTAYKAIRNVSVGPIIRPSVIYSHEVISLIVETKMTKRQYIIIRKFVNNKFCSEILPSYQQVLKAKEKCYPQRITVSEAESEIELQNLLDHTASRIIESLPQQSTAVLRIFVPCTKTSS